MMTSTRVHDNPAQEIEKRCCKCSKSGEKLAKQQQNGSTYFENAASKLEKRRGVLVNRQRYLREKIETMERSIPALMALNMLKNRENREEKIGPPPSLSTVKEIMKKLSPPLPHGDPTDRLLDKLETTVKSLNGETAELHEKIIAADIELEESQMELESLQLANKELEERLTSLEEELKIQTTPSLHSIYSDDLVCLSKIRHLGEAEMNLKKCIKQLEERESLFHRQIDRIFKSKELRKASCGGGMKQKSVNLGSGKCQVAAAPTSSSSKSVEPSSECSLKLCPVSLTPLKVNISRGQDKTVLDPSCKIIERKSKGQNPSRFDALLRGCLCGKCLKIGKQCPEHGKPTCTCCKGKCATDKSPITCNCALYLSTPVLDDDDDDDDDTRVNQQSSTDEEYCECCDCSCDDSQSDTTWS